MSNTTTATVETLTAEVRVLAVGNRQITLSVAKQLDFVELEHLHVFGRVKLGGSAPDDLVIGSDPAGNLALARYSTYRKLPSWSAYLQIDTSWSDGELPEVGWLLYPNDGCYRLRFGSGDDAIPVEIASENCRKRSREDFEEADREWYKQKDDWWKELVAKGLPPGPTPEFHLPRPDPEDFGAYGWNPGPHWTELELDAHNQLAEAERRHRLYEAAKSAPLIVLAGLK